MSDPLPHLPAHVLGAYCPRVLACGRLAGDFEMITGDPVHPFHTGFMLVLQMRGSSLVRWVDAERDQRIGEGRCVLIQPGAATLWRQPAGGLQMMVSFDLLLRPVRFERYALIPLDQVTDQPGARDVLGCDLPRIIPDGFLAESRKLMMIAYDAWLSPVHRLRANAQLASWIAALSWAAMGKQPVGFDQAIAYAQLHLDHELTTSQLISISGLGRRKFRDSVYKRFACLPRALINHLRLDAAADLLRSTDQSIETVAHRAGYRDQSAFCRAFRNRFGRSPGAFRQIPG